MTIKAIWKSDNPFLLNVNKLNYTKTIEVPDGTNMDELKDAAIKDSMEGYHFHKFEIVEK